MKKLFTLAIAAIMALPIFAATKTMNYQAVLTDANGQPLANKELTIGFGVTAGTTNYFEEAHLYTDAEGVVTHEIGSLFPEGLEKIDWSSDDIELKVDIYQYENGSWSNYSTEIQAVPKAIYAETSGDTEALKKDFERLDKYAQSLEELYGDCMVRIVEIGNRIEDQQKDNFVMAEELKDKLQAEITEITAKLGATYDQLQDQLKALQDAVAGGQPGTGGSTNVDAALKDMQTNIDALKAAMDGSFSDAFGLIDINKVNFEGLSKEVNAMYEIFSGEINNLKSHMDNALDNITKNNVKLSDLETENAILNEKVSILEERTMQQETHIAYLEDMINELKSQIENK